MNTFGATLTRVLNDGQHNATVGAWRDDAYGYRVLTLVLDSDAATGREGSTVVAYCGPSPEISLGDRLVLSVLPGWGRIVRVSRLARSFS